MAKTKFKVGDKVIYNALNYAAFPKLHGKLMIVKHVGRKYENQYYTCQNPVDEIIFCAIAEKYLSFA